MCETFLNEEKCKMNSRELDLDNVTYNRKDRTNKNGGGWIVYFHDYVKYEIRVITKLPNSEQSYKGKVKTHNYINRQNQLTTGKL